MPVRDILQLGHPILRQIAEPVPDPTAPAVARLVADLAELLQHEIDHLDGILSINRPDGGREVALLPRGIRAPTPRRQPVRALKKQSCASTYADAR